MTVEYCTEQLFKGIEEGAFYVVVDNPAHLSKGSGNGNGTTPPVLQLEDAIMQRHRSILSGRPPWSNL